MVVVRGMLLAALMLVAPSQVKIVAQGEGWALERDGKPYYVKGAGLSDASDKNMGRLAEAGGNSLRTWGVGPETPELLERAKKHGLTVTLGYWLGHKRHGFRWDDPETLKRQEEGVLQMVRSYRNDSTVLMWALGNEMEMEMEENTPTLWREVGRLAEMVKAEDPSRPVITVVAEMSKEKADLIRLHAPALDAVGINSYGGLETLAGRLKEFEWTKPYLVTEWGPNGQWEVGKTPWGQALEPTSTEKAELYRRRYAEKIRSQPQCLGSYAFIWGHKQEETATWFGMMLPTGESLEAVDAMTEAWSGRPRENRAPVIEFLSAPAEVKVGQPLALEVRATDPDGDALTYEWSLRGESTDKRTGGDAEAAPPVLDGAKGTWFTLRASEPGPYRAFVFVRDGKGNAATGNVPVNIKG